MDELQLAQQVNRRLFLQSSGIGLGAMALGSLLDRDVKAAGADTSPGDIAGAQGRRRRLARPAALSAQGQAGDLPVPVGRAVAAGPVRPQAGDLRDDTGIELPDSVRMGQRITTMTSGQKSFPVAPSIFKFAQHGQSGAWLSELLPHTADDRRRHLHHPLDADRGDQPRPGDHVRADRLAARGPAEHGVVGRLRPGEREPGPAGLRRLALARADRPAALRPPLGKRLPADALPGREAPRRQGAGALSRQPGRLLAADAPADARRHRRARRPAPRRDRRPRDRHPRRPVRAGLPHAGLGSRADRPVERAEVDPRPVRPRRPEARQLRRQLPAGPPPGRARRAVHPALPHGLGPAQRPARTRSAASATTPTSPRPP